MMSLFCFFMLVGCGSEESAPPGSLEVSWRFGGKQCSDLGVTTIRITLKNSKGVSVLDPAPTVPCSDGKATIVDVPEGTYELVLEGLDDQGHAYYQGSRAGVTVESGKQTTVSPVINLELKKSEVLLNWEFPQGTGHCNGNQVTQVEVSVYDSSSSSVHEGTYPCLLDAQNYPELGVLLAQLRGNEELTFILYALNNKTPTPQRTHRGEKTIKTVPGERTPVIVLLEPCPAPDQCP